MSNIVVVAKCKVAPGKAEVAIEVLTRCLEASQHEAGVLRYTLHHDAIAADTLVLVEVYENADALRFHRTTPHVAALRDELTDLLVNPIDVLELAPIPVGDPLKSSLGD